MTRSMAALYPKNIDRCKGPLLPKMAYYKDHFMNFSKDGFIQGPWHMDVYMHNSALHEYLVYMTSMYQKQISTSL